MRAHTCAGSGRTLGATPKSDVDSTRGLDAGFFGTRVFFVRLRLPRRRSPAGARRPSPSPATRPGASPPISPSCRSRCAGRCRQVRRDELQPHIHDVRAMSACASTADVSLQRGAASGPITDVSSRNKMGAIRSHHRQARATWAVTERPSALAVLRLITNSHFAASTTRRYRSVR